MIAATSLFPTTPGSLGKPTRDWNCQRSATAAVSMKELAATQVFKILSLKHTAIG